jgi:hypothetical protein
MKSFGYWPYNHPLWVTKLKGFKLLVTENHSLDQLRMIAESPSGAEIVFNSFDVCAHKFSLEERVSVMQTIQAALIRPEPEVRRESLSEES